MFQQWTGTWTDECAKNAKDVQNQQVQRYTLLPQSTQLSCCKPDAPIRIPNEVYEYPNIHTKIGYGTVDSCAIDSDNKMLLGADQLTHARCKQQLFSRVFQAVPNLRPGNPNPDEEAQILQGLSTPLLQCSKFVGNKELSELQYDGVFTPMIPSIRSTVQTAETVVEPWQRGGEVTREYVKNEDYLKSCGMRNPRQK